MAKQLLSVSRSAQQGAVEAAKSRRKKSIPSSFRPRREMHPTVGAFQLWGRSKPIIMQMPFL